MMDTEPETSTPAATRQPIQIDLAGIQKQAALKAAANDPDFIRKSRLAFSESFGAAAWLLSHDEIFRTQPISLLEAAISAPLRLGQYKIYKKQGVPFAYASWAFLSEEIERRIMGGGAGIGPEEWRSGDRLWGVDLVAPFGARGFAQTDLQERVFKSTPFRLVSDERRRLFEVSDDDISAAAASLADLSAPGGVDDVSIIKIDAGHLARLAPHFILFAEDFYNTSPVYQGISIGRDKVLSVARATVQNPNAALFSAVCAERLCGVFVGEILDMRFGAKRMAQEIAFVVHPAMRGKRVGERLLAAFEDWVAEQGVDLVQYVHTSGINVEAAERAYGKVGADRIGGVFRKWIRK